MYANARPTEHKLPDEEIDCSYFGYPIFTYTNHRSNRHKATNWPKGEIDILDKIKSTEIRANGRTKEEAIKIPILSRGNVIMDTVRILPSA